MITLFVTQGELIACLILTALLALYGWSKHSLAKHIELDAKIRNMSDDELIKRFQNLMNDYEKKPTYWKGQELVGILKAQEKRKLLKNVPDTELIDHYRLLAKKYEQAPTYWKKKELAYYRKEVEKRHLL